MKNSTIVIKKMLLDAGMTQRQLADAIGEKHVPVNQAINGSRASRRYVAISAKCLTYLNKIVNP